jgi:hypothetical protein
MVQKKRKKAKVKVVKLVELPEQKHLLGIEMEIDAIPLPVDPLPAEPVEIEVSAEISSTKIGWTSWIKSFFH